MAELETILRDYYDIENLLSGSALKKIHEYHDMDLIKFIYNEIFEALCSNWKSLPKAYYDLRKEKDIYFNDMMMMVYLYMVNMEKPLSLNHLDTSSSTQSHMQYIEQSGFGNVLGLRRKSDNMVKYNCSDELTRREDKRKYNIPYLTRYLYIYNAILQLHQGWTAV